VHDLAAAIAVPLLDLRGVASRKDVSDLILDVFEAVAFERLDERPLSCLISSWPDLTDILQTSGNGSSSLVGSNVSFANINVCPVFEVKMGLGSEPAPSDMPSL
jgi:hypothetical protein